MTLNHPSPYSLNIHISNHFIFFINILLSGQLSHSTSIASSRLPYFLPIFLALNIISLFSLSHIHHFLQDPEKKNAHRLLIHHSLTSSSCMYVSRSVVSDLFAVSPPGSYDHGILQARILEWAAILFSRESSQGMEPGLPYCRQILYCLSHQGSNFFLNLF